MTEIKADNPTAPTVAQTVSRYEKFPTIQIDPATESVCKGKAAVSAFLEEHLGGRNLILEAYPGVSEDLLRELAEHAGIKRIFWAKDILRDRQELAALLAPILTDDRVFGRMYYGTLGEFVDGEKLAAMRAAVSEEMGGAAVVGFGASLVAKEGLLVYADISRWEIQLRYRAGMPNYLSDNPDEDILRKYKQGYFLEWRIADKVKAAFRKKMDCYIDANTDEPVLISRTLFDRTLQETAARPFRTVPYFDPGVWGGQWMKQVCGLDPAQPNYAWSFDGVPEENALRFDFDGIVLEMPAMNLVLSRPKELLGQKVFARFGAEFPIRFDFLDTMGGQNLSLQVHPTTEYIKKQFGMPYTQDESYYMLDAGEDACVYLGLKDGVSVDELVAALEEAQQNGTVFDAERYINKWPAKKHDHFLIPAGTCHCSGKNAMVLEVSATPYIFTFKLWDWGRVGLDGKPRPIHIAHGRQVIAERYTKWVKDNLVSQIRTVSKTADCLEEHTGLHELEFIETRRFTTESAVEIDCHESVNMLNLVDGSRCVVESVDGGFAPYEVHYAETFIVPEQVGRYRIRAVDGEIKLLQAFVRV